MEDYVVNRLDNEIVTRVLSSNDANAAGVIIRLALWAGLMRDEIAGLTWGQVDFLNREIALPDRTVPISEEFCAYLRELMVRRNGVSEMVALSDRDRTPLAPQSISRLVRKALDAEGAEKVRLIDLRHDFILRQLQDHDWQYVSRIAGIEAAAMRVHFAEHLPEKKVSTRIRRKSPVQLDEVKLWKLLQTERDTPAGLAMWLTWQLGLQAEELVSLRWPQVDFKKGQIALPGRTVAMTAGVDRLLRPLCPAEGDGYVLLSPKSRKPYDVPRLSRLVRAALIRGRLDDVSLCDLRMDYDIRVSGETRVVEYLRGRRCITRNEAAELLEVSPSTAYRRLKRMVERGKLTQVGARYYLYHTVVPPELQQATILEYLSREGFAYRQDIAELLHIEPRQCEPILKRMVASGEIVQERQKYLPKEA